MARFLLLRIGEEWGIKVGFFLSEPLFLHSSGTFSCGYPPASLCLIHHFHSTRSTPLCPMPRSSPPISLTPPSLTSHRIPHSHVLHAPMHPYLPCLARSLARHLDCTYSSPHSTPSPSPVIGTVPDVTPTSPPSRCELPEKEWPLSKLLLPNSVNDI